MRKLESGAIPTTIVMSNDQGEVIILLDGNYLLINKKEMWNIGSEKEQAKARLIELGRDKSFPDFMK